MGNERRSRAVKPVWRRTQSRLGFSFREESIVAKLEIAVFILAVAAVSGWAVWLW